MNVGFIIGHLGADPEVRTLESGVKVATFRVATNETWKDKSGEKQQRTDWHNVVLWRGLAEVAEKWLKKGNQVAIMGKIQNRNYETKEGDVKWVTEFVGEKMEMISKAEGGVSGRQEEAPPPYKDDDIPF